MKTIDTSNPADITIKETEICCAIEGVIALMPQERCTLVRQIAR
jgi:hypothetical protein